MPFYNVTWVIKRLYKKYKDFSEGFISIVIQIMLVIK